MEKDLKTFPESRVQRYESADESLKTFERREGDIPPRWISREWIQRELRRLSDYYSVHQFVDIQSRTAPLVIQALIDEGTIQGSFLVNTSLADLCAVTRASRNSVRNALRLLATAGYLTLVEQGKGRRPSRYRIERNIKMLREQLTHYGDEESFDSRKVGTRMRRLLKSQMLQDRGVSPNGLRVIAFLEAAGQPVTALEVAQGLDLHPATARNLLDVLHGWRVVTYDLEWTVPVPKMRRGASGGLIHTGKMRRPSRKYETTRLCTWSLLPRDEWFDCRGWYEPELPEPIIGCVLSELELERFLDIDAPTERQRIASLLDDLLSL